MYKYLQLRKQTKEQYKSTQEKKDSCDAKRKKETKQKHF